MRISLRPYQNECIERVTSSFENRSSSRQLVVLPTGAGKTIIMASLAQTLGKRTLLLAHREELIDQAVEKFHLVYPQASVGVCMAERNEIEGRDVVIGSIQSCCRNGRLKALAEANFGLALVDEAHHASSESYVKTLRHLGFLGGNPKKLLLGVTATPMRSDKRELGDIFEEVTYSISIERMIQDGYLSPVMGRRLLTRTTIDGIRSREGDFLLDQLTELVNTDERNNFIATSYKKYARDRKGIIFCCDVEHSKRVADALKEAGITSEAVYGDMPSVERKAYLTGLRSGSVQVLTSCGILTEGFDEPSISCIGMTRPTKSKGLYIQCIGRGLRLHPGKENCLILDFADSGHGLNAAITLNNAIPSTQSTQERESTSEYVPREYRVRSDQVDEAFDVIGTTSRFTWVDIGDGEWSLSDDDGNEIVVSPSGSGYTAKVFWKGGAQFMLVDQPLSLEMCSGIVQDFANKRFKLNFATVEAPWMAKEAPATDAQLDLLSRLLSSESVPDGITKAEAALKIRQLLARGRKQWRQRQIEDGPMTEKQETFLKRKGIDTSGMTKLSAMKRIAEIKIAR